MPRKPRPIDDARRILSERDAAHVRTFTSSDGLTVDEYSLAPDGRYLYLMQWPESGGIFVLLPASSTGLLADELEAIRRA